MKRFSREKNKERVGKTRGHVQCRNFLNSPCMHGIWPGLRFGLNFIESPGNLQTIRDALTFLSPLLPNPRETMRSARRRASCLCAIGTRTVRELCDFTGLSAGKCSYPVKARLTVEFPRLYHSQSGPNFEEIVFRCAVPC
jgi:hypothetical protein